jgi:predicted DNA-binding antitoxin AbrB/MazE fold protein
MTRTITVVYDGEVLRPTEPLDLERDAEYRVTIEDTQPRADDDATVEDERYPLTKFLKYATDMGIPDFAEQHDHYLYGTPKK